MKHQSFSSRYALSGIVSLIAVATASLMSPPAFAEPVEPETAASVSASVDGWGNEIGDLKTDTSIRLGVLSNGMKYALKKNETPKGGASVRFTIHSGAYEETAQERGYSHFLEHMAFNGSTNIPEGELVKRLERLGLQFGADTNAETSLDYVRYKLDLPKADEASIDAALLMMREIASELSISPSAVERERGILLTENSDRNVAQRRRLADFLNTAFPELGAGEALHSQENAIKSVTAAQLRAFYHGLYRPDNATLAIVGDFDVDTLEAEIRKRFSTWQPTGMARPKRSILTSDNRPVSISNFADPSAVDIVVVQRSAPYIQLPNSWAKVKADNARAVAQIILSKRLDRLARAENPKVLGGQAINEEPYRLGRSFGALMVAKDGDWQSALSITEQQLRSAAQYGFTKSEVGEAVALLATVYRNAATQSGSRQSVQIAEELSVAAHKKTIIESPVDMLAAFEKFAPELTVEAVNAAFRDTWKVGANTIHITTKTPISDGVNAIANEFSRSSSVAVAAQVDQIAKPFAYDAFGKPGKIVANKLIGDLDIRTVRFANGVKLNIKKTDFEKGKIGFAMRVGSGRAGLPKDKAGLSTMFDVLNGGDGLGKHSFDELQKLIAGKTVSLAMQTGEDAYIAKGSTTAADLELQLKLLAAKTSDMGFRRETAAQWQGVASILRTRYMADPVQRYITASGPLLSKGDDRFGVSNPDELGLRTIEELKRAIDADMKTGPLEIALVGDVDETEAILLVAKTLGALPKRAKTAPISANKKRQIFDTPQTAVILTHDGKDEQGLVAFHWPTDDDNDLKSAQGRELLATILGLQMTEVIREKLGATYTPEAFSVASRSFNGFGHITALATAAPENMNKIFEATKEIAKMLRETPVADDLLLRARRPIAERLEKQDRENASWLDLAQFAQGSPLRLERWRQRKTTLAAITPEYLQNLARQYLLDDAILEVRVVSKSVAEK